MSFADDHPSLVGSSNEVNDTSAMLPKVKKFTDWYTEQGGLTGRLVYARWKRGAQKYSANLSKDLSRRWSKPSQEDLRAIAKEFASRLMSNASWQFRGSTVSRPLDLRGSKFRLIMLTWAGRSGRIRFFVRAKSDFKWIAGEGERGVRSVARDLRFVPKSGRNGVKRPKPKPIPRTAVT